MFDAILPAGGTIDEAFAAQVGTSNKALIQFEGQTILERVIDALKASGRVRRIAVIGPEEVHQSAGAGKADLLLREGSTGPDNIMRGLDALAAQPDPPQKVLVVTTDLPFLTPEIVNRFIDACPTDVHITVPLISKAEFQSRFPECMCTFIRLKDDTWTTGCMYILDVQALRSSKPYIDKIFEVRKSKVGMAKLLGVGFLCKFLTKTLTVPDVERKIQSMLHCSGKAIEHSPPELAYDIDDLSDYEYAMKHLASKP
ncbi:MAG: nucleotidyltransferase family protein [Fimbriimonas sp.]